ncbi:MAG: HAD-IIIA family hydrolase [Burkholderiaceae bacterium]|nr:HAD-IIIA family hydrolase [Burkholderiaceae bacterium]
MPRPAVFLDKDGTLLVDVPFNVDPQRMCFAEGVPRALARLAALGAPLIVVSNQAGVALGRFDASRLDAVRGHLGAMFAQCGASLTAVYFCTHHPQGSVAAHAVACDCRKPRPGLLQRAAREHAIDLQRSWMIGDILDDVEAGKRAGCRSVLVCNGNETEWIGGPFRRPDHLVRDLGEAAALVEAAGVPRGVPVAA